MSCQQHVGTGPQEHAHRFLSPVHQVFLLEAFGQVERMVGDNELGHPLVQRRHALVQPLHLLPVDAAVLEGERTRGVDAGDGDLVIGVKRLQVRADELAVLGQRREEALEHVVERHVVVAGNHDLRLRQPVQELARRPEFVRLGALGQVAGNHHHIRRQAVDQRNDGGGDGFIDAAEVDIRQVNQDFHTGWLSAGTNTRNAPGRTR